jgi:tetratricopeptide (TPR) repeat protein
MTRGACGRRARGRRERVGDAESFEAALVAWPVGGWHHRCVHAAFIWLRGSVEQVLDGRSSRERDMKSWRGYMQMSRAIGRQDFAAATASCERLLAENPHDAFAMAMLAHCHVALGRPQEALACAEGALKQAPDNFQLLRLATNAAFLLNEHSRARAFAVRALVSMMCHVR